MLYYVTGNKYKFNSTKDFFAKQGIEIIRKSFDIPEIQGESIEEIASDKAQKAFELLQQPLFINDSGWEIPSLNGFPGPYMKYINDWFSPQDFINLMRGKEDRSIILKQVVVYIDKNTQKMFERDNQGQILERIADVEGRTTDKIISFDGELSIGEQRLKGNSLREVVWDDFVNWYQQNKLD